MKKKAQAASSSDVSGVDDGVPPEEPSLEVLVIFQHQGLSESFRSLHVYGHGASLHATQQDFVLSSTCYRMANQPMKMMLPTWSTMASFVDTQKSGHAAGGWECVLDFAVYSPLPTSLSPLLSPSRNPFLAHLPSLHADLTFVEAVIQKGAQAGRAEPPVRPTQCIPSPVGTCVTNQSDGIDFVPFIGSRVHKSLPLPSPRPDSMSESNSPHGALWNEVDSLVDLLSSADSPGPIFPLVSLHPNFPSPIAGQPGRSPGRANQREQKGRGHSMICSPSPSVASPLNPPPGGFGGQPGSEPRPDHENASSYNSGPFVPGFIPDRIWGPWGSGSDLHQQLALFAECPAFVSPENSPGTLYEDFLRQQRDPGIPSDPEKDGRLYRPPPRLEIPGSPELPDLFSECDDRSCSIPAEHRALLPRSQSTQPGERPREDVARCFHRASSAPAALLTPPLQGDPPLVDPALLSPLGARARAREEDPSASLWVCINADASEGVRPGVSFLPPVRIINSVQLKPSSIDDDQIVPEYEARKLREPLAVAQPVAPVRAPAGEGILRSVETSDEFMAMATGLTSPDFGRSCLLSPASNLSTEMEDAAAPGGSPELEGISGDQSPKSLALESVRNVVMSRDPKRASARMMRITLEELQTYFNMPIAKAGRLLGVGLTVLKKRCRDFGIPRWPHRKIKSLEMLIDTIKDLADPRDGSSIAAASLDDAVQRLQQERAQIAGWPAIRMAQETLKLRQACFKANFRIRVQTGAPRPRANLKPRPRARSKKGGRSSGATSATGG